LHQREITRRLSLHNSSTTNASINERKELFKVRSLDVFGHADLMMSALSRFSVLRVLQLEDCSGLDNNHLKDLDKLYLLKFLRLHNLNVTELPESIGKLESLETLDIRGNQVTIMLPLSFGKLGKLVRLLANMVELPDGVALENMKSLQELVGVHPTLHLMTEIGKLRELKVLKLVMKEESGRNTGNWDICLQMLPSLLQVLVLRTPIFYSLDFMAQVPLGLRTIMCSHLETFPRWIDQSLSCLTVLSIRLFGVRVQPEHLDKLAELPFLRFLRIDASIPPYEQEKLVIHSSPSSFRCLTELRISCHWMFLEFQPGAMPELQRLCLCFNARRTKEHFRTNNFDYGLEKLPSLQHVIIRLWDSQKQPEAQDAIKKTVNDHPNHPSLDFSFI